MNLKLTSIVAMAVGIGLAAQTSQAQTDVKGATKVLVGSDIEKLSFLGKNKTGRKIHDFTFCISSDCNVKIKAVTVTSKQSGGAGDWDVDDDRDNDSQEAKERDDNVASDKQGTKARVDNKGTGHDNFGDPEPGDQKNPGKAIKKKAEFTIAITFDQKTTVPGYLCITPTDNKDNQIASLPAGLQSGTNVFTVDNATALASGMGAGVVNATGGRVNALEFETTGDYQLVETFQVNPATDSVLVAISCGTANLCTLFLASCVSPGNTIGFDASFNQMAPDSQTLLNVRPILTPVPTHTQWGLIFVIVAVAGFFGYMILRRRRAVVSSR